MPYKHRAITRNGNKLNRYVTYTRFYLLGKNSCVKCNTKNIIEISSTCVKVVYFILIRNIVLYYKCSVRLL